VKERREVTEQECIQFIAGGRPVIATMNLGISDGFAGEIIPCPITGDWQDGWIQRMTRAYGGTVRDREGGPWYGWDWGQALCRAQYGLDWNEIVGEQRIVSPDEESVRIARAWEAGEWPSWAYTDQYDPQETE